MKVSSMKSCSKHNARKHVCLWRKRTVIAVAALAFFAGAVLVANAGASEPSEDFVVICPIDGDILDGMSVLVQRAVTEEAVGAKAILFIIDTYGGRVDSAIDIANVILESPVPSIAFITGRGAISAGALISYACDQIVMAPGANIGASTPISPGVEMTEEMNEKSMSFLRAKYRALGEENGHNPLIGEAMVDPSIELYGAPEGKNAYRVYKVDNGKVSETYAVEPKQVFSAALPASGLMAQYAQPDTDSAVRRIQDAVRSVTGSDTSQSTSQPESSPTGQDRVTAAATGSSMPIEGLPPEARLVSPAGKLLTLTTREAREIGLIQVSEDTPEKTLAALGFGMYKPVRVSMNWAEIIFAFLTSPMISGLLLMCGIGGIYIEFKTPGFGLPGIIGGVCLALFFGSRLIIGIADWLDVLLVVAGISMLVAEIFFIPGFGVAGIFGILCLIVGIYLSLTRAPIPQYTWDFMRLRDAGVTILLAAALFMLLIALTWKVFPRTRLAQGLLQSHVQATASGYTVQTETDTRIALGLQGKSLSMLRPAGRGRFEGVTYDVMTRGEFIEAGVPIEIIQVEGNRYVVRELEKEA